MTHCPVRLDCLRDRERYKLLTRDEIVAGHCRRISMRKDSVSLARSSFFNEMRPFVHLCGRRHTRMTSTVKVSCNHLWRPHNTEVAVYFFLTDVIFFQPDDKVLVLILLVSCSICPLSQSTACVPRFDRYFPLRHVFILDGFGHFRTGTRRNGFFSSLMHWNGAFL